MTIASKNPLIANEIASTFSCEYIKTKTHDDVIGAEYAAMLKNIYAIAAGIFHGLGYGDNLQSVLMSNSIREMKRFIKKVYKMKRKINETVYLGDLLVTGYSTFSRNRMFGNMIGKGYTVKSAQMEMNMIIQSKTTKFDEHRPFWDIFEKILRQKINRKLTKNDSIS